MTINLQKYALRGCLVIALLLVACAPSQLNQPKPEPMTLKVVALPFLSYGPFFIAEEEGYFAEQGLEVEFVKSGSEEAVPALAKGGLDVLGGTLSTALLKAMARGADVKFVADRGYIAPDGCTYSGFLARRDLVEAGELESPARLRGRRVVMEREEMASMDGYRMEKLLEIGGLSFDDTELVDVSLPAQLDAFAKGTIDLSCTSEPWVSRLVNSGRAVLWMTAQQVIPDCQMLVVVYGCTLLKDNPDVGRRFMVAYRQGVQQYSEGKTERNLKILAEYTGLDEELVKQACWPAFRDDGRINVQSVLDFQCWAIEKGYLDSPPTEEQFWDPSFVEHANQVLGIPSQ